MPTKRKHMRAIKTDAEAYSKNIFDSAGLDPAYRQVPIDPFPGGCNALKIGSPQASSDIRRLGPQNRAWAQKPDLTFTEFVRSRFVPEHLSVKKAASQIHYRALLKHVLGPSEVDRIFQASDESKSRLKPDPDWPYLGDMRLGDIRPAHVQKLMMAAQVRGYSPQTVMHIRNVVSVIFSHAKRCQYYVGSNPALLVKTPEVARKFSYSMTLTEMKDVLGLMHHPEKEMALVVMFTGANIAEVCGLQWKHVNLTGMSIGLCGDSVPSFSIAIRKRWHRGKVADVIRKRARNLEIPEFLLGVFLKLKSLSDCAAPDDFVFASRTGSPINPANIGVRRLKPIGQRLQMPLISWHLFRRTYLTLASTFGVQAHRSIAMTLHAELSRGDLTAASRHRASLPRPRFRNA